MNASAPVLLAVAAMLFAGCRSMRPSDLPEDEDWLVVVKTLRIPDNEPLIAQLGQHTFLDMKKGSEERWRRIEIFNERSGVVAEDLGWWEPRQDERWRRGVRVLRVFRGEQARRMAIDLEIAALSYPSDGEYRPWPGPNSNTFLAWLSRRVAGLDFEFDHNAVGKDYARGLESGPTSSKTGIRVDTPLLGFAVGLAEGIEVHFLGLTLGVSLRRPALKLPALPRIGFPIR